MKLSQIFNTDAEPNEIESKYLWNTHIFIVNPTIWRFNLSTLALDSSWTLSTNPYWMRPLTILPNNQFFGIYIDTFYDLKCYFISDEYFNFKSIKTSKWCFSNVRYDFVSCYYEDSVFIFESELSTNGQNYRVHDTKRYLISQNKWINLANNPFDTLISCTGFQQKIIIGVKNLPGVLIYDIILDSYTYQIPIKCKSYYNAKTIIKKKNKLYLIIYVGDYEIYETDNPLSEWTFVHSFKSDLRDWQFDASTYYKGSLYCLSINNYNLYNFELGNIEAKEIANLENPNNEEKQIFKIYMVFIKD